MQTKSQIDSMSERNRGEVINSDSFEKKLRNGGSLRIKFGVDPTRPDLHLGHGVALWKLRELQDMGHKIIFLIGDFTAKIGDPTGRNNARPILSDKEIEANTKTYLEQVGKILDIGKCEIRKNSEWYGKMDFSQVIKILGKVTLSQVLEREDFRKRLAENSDIGIHEIIYPIMQGYDSVELKADVEVGGQDQKLNMLMGRDMQRRYSQSEQDVVIIPLLVGTDGVRKMSKSYGNYVGLSDSPENQFGKIMSIPDSAIEDYIILACNFSKDEITELRTKISEGENPKTIKEKIAQRVVELYWGEEKASEAKDQFDKVHRLKELPEKIKEFEVKTGGINLVAAIAATDLAPSNSEAFRLIKQGAVKIDGKKATDPQIVLSLDSPVVLQVGKIKFVKIKSADKK